MPTACRVKSSLHFDSASDLDSSGRVALLPFCRDAPKIAQTREYASAEANLPASRRRRMHATSRVPAIYHHRHLILSKDAHDSNEFTKRDES